MAKKILFGTLLCAMLLGFLFVSCGTTSSGTTSSGTTSINRSNAMMRIEVGMTKAQVIDLMGNPTKRSVRENTETWTYGNSYGGVDAEIYFSDGLVNGMRFN